MRAEISVFLAAIALSLAAFTLTMYNVPMGAVELNPLLGFWIGQGLPLIGFIGGWAFIILMYRFTVFSKRFNFPVEQKYLALGLMLGITFLDFFSDFMGYLYIISH